MTRPADQREIGVILISLALLLAGRPDAELEESHRNAQERRQDCPDLIRISNIQGAERESVPRRFLSAEPLACL